MTWPSAAARRLTPARRRRSGPGRFPSLTIPPTSTALLRRWIRVSLSVLALFTWPLSLYRSLVTHGFPEWYLISGLATMGVALVFCLTQWGLPEGPRIGLRIFAVITMVLSVVFSVGIHQPLGDLDYNPLNASLVIGLVYVPLVFPAPAALVLVVISLGLWGWRRVQLVGAIQGLGETMMILGTIVGAGLIAWTIFKDVGRMDSQLVKSQRRRVSEMVNAERERVGDRWNAMIHDKVLAALTLAGRGQVLDAATLATEALSGLQGSSIAGWDDSRTRIAQQASALGLRLILDAPAWPPGTTGEAMEGAVCESLLNVAKHAGVDVVRVRTTKDGDQWTTTVTDTGRGFDPATVSERHFGLRNRVMGTMEAVGGTARISSEPGAGTSIVLSAVEERPEQDQVGVPGLFRFGGALGAGAIVIAACLVIGSLHVLQSIHPGIDGAAIVVIPVITFVLVVADTRGRVFDVAAVAMAATLAILLWNTKQPQIADWRTWYVGSLNVAVCVMGIRRGFRYTVAVVTSAVVAGLAALYLRGERGFEMPMLSSLWQTYLWAVTAASVKYVREQAYRVITRRNAEMAADEAEILAAAARDEDTRAELPVVSEEATAMLRRIATREDLSEAQRHECVQLESLTRDQLVAHTLLTPDLVERIQSARSRDARVVIMGHEERDAALVVFRAVSKELLDRCGAGDRVQLSWRRDAAGHLGSASLVGEGVGRRWGEIPPSNDDPQLRVTCDEMSLLVEFLDEPGDGAADAA